MDGGAVPTTARTGAHSLTFTSGASSLGCFAVSSCVAIGSGPSGATSATWEGSSWTEVALPAGVTGVGSLECLGSKECLVRVTGLGTGGTLAWMAGGWHQATSAPAGIDRLACLPMVPRRRVHRLAGIPDRRDVHLDERLTERAARAPTEVPQ